ncbi:MAG: 3-phosphoshikimate 1-carboxyvinyltransferase [candidate division Zixibacteria bacterium]|nr:3-phosphoshikimate 1-carboxyvinyltransferase [candidate division Zixibacteria bacterium]
MKKIVLTRKAETGPEYKVVRPAGPLKGEATVPGDKSISHRAAILASAASGRSEFANFSHNSDCLSTLTCLEALGVGIQRETDRLLIAGKGFGQFRAPSEPLYCGNSGTTMRLLCGLLAGCNFEITLDGDSSLRTRPMERVLAPLAKMGLKIIKDGPPPFTIAGGKLSGIEYLLPVASAQVKSAILLAGLQAEGKTTVVEKIPTRDHTERMLSAMKAPIEIFAPSFDPATLEGRLAKDQRERKISVTQTGTLVPLRMKIPGDFSSAAFLVAAAILVPKSKLTVREVGLNPTRTAFLNVLKRMGAEVNWKVEEEQAGEPIGSITARHSQLRGVKISGKIVPNLIDELPLLACLAASAEGTTVIRDAGELRKKESDRIAAVTSNLRKMGAKVGELEDGWAIEGPTEPAGADIESFGDHRIAMAFSVLGLVASGETLISQPECVEVSFPGFFETLEGLAR